MSLLQDAAAYEERHWSNYLTRIRSQAARDYLSQIGAWLPWSCSRPCYSMVPAAISGMPRAPWWPSVAGAALQTASGKSAPSFKGQSFGPGDSLTTDATGSVTLTFLDGSVVQLAPNSQLRLTQSDSFRNGQQRRQFQLASGSALVYGPANLETRFATPHGATAVKKGSFAFAVSRGVSVDSGTSLVRYAVQPGALARVERAVLVASGLCAQQAGDHGLRDARQDRLPAARCLPHGLCRASELAQTEPHHTPNRQGASSRAIQPLGRDTPAGPERSGGPEFLSQPQRKRLCCHGDRPRLRGDSLYHHPYPHRRTTRATPEKLG